MDARMGDNINGPSVIEAPSWAGPALGRTYLYFADHKGTYIRLAHADALEGPWRIHSPVFEPAEWKSVWTVVQRTTPPSEPPRLGEMVRLVAQLGGYVKRKHSDPPGPQTTWIGLQRMYDFALSWKLFGPDARAGPQLV